MSDRSDFFEENPKAVLIRGSKAKNCEFIFYGCLIKPPDLMSLNQDNKTAIVDFSENKVGQSNCEIVIEVNSLVHLKNLKVDCIPNKDRQENECIIAFRTKYLSFDSVDIKATGLELTANTLNSKQISLEAEKGLVYILRSQGVENAFFNITNGEIIYQSHEGFTYDFTSSTPAYCLTAPVIIDSQFSECPISNLCEDDKRKKLLELYLLFIHYLQNYWAPAGRLDFGIQE